MTSYRIFDELQKTYSAGGASGHGIRMRVANFFFDKPIEENAEEYEKMCEIEEVKVSHLSDSVPVGDRRLTSISLQIRGFERDPSFVTKHAVCQTAGVVGGYHVTPLGGAGEAPDRG